MGEVACHRAPLDGDVLDWFQLRQEATNRRLAGGGVSYTKPDTPGPLVRLHGARSSDAKREMFALGLEDLLNESAIRLRIRSGCALKRSEDGHELVLEIDDGRIVRLSDYVSHYDAAIDGIANGKPLAELRDLVVASGGEWNAIAFLDQVRVLCRTGFVEYPLVETGTEYGVIVPQWASFVPSLAPRTPPTEDRLQRFACVRRSGNAWLVESPLCGARLVLADLSALDAPLVRRALAAAGFLQEARMENDSCQDALKLWEFQDLLFHTHQRRGWHRDMLGAHFPFVGEIDPSPAERPSWPGKRIGLPRAPVDSGGESFASVLERRRTVRRFDDSRPISMQELGALLDRSARIRSSRVVPVATPTGQSALFEITQRPYPSAGACHELEIYPVVARCADLACGVYHYDASHHSLVRIPASDADVSRVVADAKRASGDEANPQVILAIAARFARVMWKYRSIGYGNILRNTGALYQTLYLAATELGLSACAVGTADSALFARITGLDPLVEGTVGECIIGRTLQPDPRSSERDAP